MSDNNGNRTINPIFLSDSNTYLPDLFSLYIIMDEWIMEFIGRKLKISNSIGFNPSIQLKYVCLKNIPSPCLSSQEPTITTLFLSQFNYIFIFNFYLICLCLNLNLFNKFIYQLSSINIRIILWFHMDKLNVVYNLNGYFTFIYLLK